MENFKTPRLQEIMSHKIQFILFLLLFLPVSMSAGESERFAAMACRSISTNRFVLQCELQHERIIDIRTVDNCNLRILCLWIPQTKDDGYGFEGRTTVFKSEVTHVLVGYGQTPYNPLFYYYLPAKKTPKKLKTKTLEKYRLQLPLCDYHWGK